MIDPLLAAVLFAAVFLAGSAAAAPEPVFEAGPVRPLALSPSGKLLLALNIPDHRLEVFGAGNGGLTRLGETVVGLEPVAIALRSETEAYVVNHLSDSVSVVDLADPRRPFVKATLQVGDEPRDVVVGGPERDRIFVTAERRGQNRPGDPALTTPGIGRAEVWIYRARDLAAPPRLLALFCDSLRALAVSPDGTRVYAAAFLSGNRTTVLNEMALNPFWTILQGDGHVPVEVPPLENVEGFQGPASGIIVRFEDGKWIDPLGNDRSARVRFNLPDRDLFVIDAAADPPREIERVSGVGTVLFNVAVNPADGRLYVSNLESRNHLRLEPAVRGHPVENRITIVDGGAVRPVHLNPHIDYQRAPGTPEEIALSLALPLAMEFSSDGRKLYTVAFGSARVAVLDPEGTVLDHIAVGGGPCGLALDERAGRLYVLNRFDQTISIVDLAAKRQLEAVPLRHDPEPPAIREGRRFLYDARVSSAHGDAACGSCHIFADLDGLAWDLGDPAGRVEVNPLLPVEAAERTPLLWFHPLKGPMTTQSLRGLEGAGAMHWRGDRNGGTESPFDAGKAFLAFRPAFRDLLGKETEFPEADLAKLRDFVLALRYPPNPIARLDGEPTAGERAGRDLFTADGSRTGAGGDGSACTDCHTLPLGTGGRAASSGSQAFKVPHLRDLYQKVGMFGSSLPSITTVSPLRLESVPTPHLGDQVRGFGFQHDGSIPTLYQHLLHPLGTFTFPDEPDRSGVGKARELEAFLLAFPTGLAPAVGQQVTLAAGGPEADLQRLGLFEGRAQAGDGDLVLHGLFRGEIRGFLLAGDARLQSDRSAEVLTGTSLVEAVQAGEAILTATMTPPGTGWRAALDRDGDGIFDRDEVDLGSDPADPASPGGGPRILRGDCSTDGRLDLSDAIAGLDFLFLGGAAPPCRDLCDANRDGSLDLSDPVAILGFLFLGGPPPGRYPACEEAAAECPAGCR